MRTHTPTRSRTHAYGNQQRMPCGCRLCAEHMGSKSGTKAHDGNAGIAGIAYFPPQVDPGSGLYQALWALQHFSEGTPKQTKCMVEQVEAVWARSNFSRSGHQWTFLENEQLLDSL